jgi:tetraacyldisaccharide 4'-kinase
MNRGASIILSPLGVLYGAIIETRASLYRRGLLKTSKLNAPVISVGNITTGGTGKTPLAEYIARVVAGEGRKVCILTRGYGRENPKARVLVSDGKQVLVGEKEAGDEPLLLAENLLGIAAVISDRDRFTAGKWAISELGSEVLILDDGFQHVQLARNLDVVTIDAMEPWGGGRILPAGRLRELRGGLTRADFIVITRADQAEDLNSSRSEIDEWTNHRPLFTSRMRVRGLRKVGTDGPDVEDGGVPNAATPVVAFCAIGNPRAFIKQLGIEGITPIEVSIFRDHHKYDQHDLDSLVRKAHSVGAKSLITTAKDAVKLRDLSVDLPCYVLEIEICIDNEASFIAMIREAIERG